MTAFYGKKHGRSDMNKEWKTRIDTLYECSYGRASSFEEEFERCELESIKQIYRSDNNIIVICVVKDDLIRIKKFIDFYRKLGVLHFAFVDNGSSDGTYEYILEQEDCDVYVCGDKYSSLRRVVWLNKLISKYDSSYWFIMVDSDEFLFYQDMENISLTQLVKMAENNHLKRISGFLLDMYPKENLFELDCEESFFVEYKYFDMKGYDIHNTNHGVSIIGGPRKRVYGVENELAKCPIFKLSDKDIVASSHFLLPRIKAKENPIWLAIGHYKFLGKKDIKKIDDAVRDKNYARGSYEYKAYKNGIQKGDTSFYSDDFSLELKSSDDLKKLPFIMFDIGEE